MLCPQKGVDRIHRELLKVSAMLTAVLLVHLLAHTQKHTHTLCT